MKKAINQNGKLVHVSDDTVVNTADGVHYLLSAKELAEYEAKTNEREAGAAARDALVEITRLESEITPRRLREAVLGTDDGWLTNQEALITVERDKL